MSVERETQKPARASGRWRRGLTWETFGVPLAVLAVCLLFGLLAPQFFQLQNIANIGRQTAALALVAWGMTMIIINAGIDLSPGAVVALVSVIAATVLKEFGPAAGVLAGVTVGLGCGLLNGVLISKLRMPPFIATLGVMSAARGAALTYTGGVPVFGLRSDWFAWLGAGSVLGLPVIVVVALLGFALTYSILRFTKLGVYTYAIGGNETAARWAGIPVDRYKILIYSYAGLLTGIAGVLLAARVNSGQPLLGTSMELQAIAAVCIGGTSLFGGRGSLAGTFFGVLLTGVLNNGLNLLGVSSFIQQIVIGATILIAVLLSLWRQR